VHFAAGSLSRDQDRGSRINLQHRTWPEWQVLRTQGAGPDSTQQRQMRARGRSWRLDLRLPTHDSPVRCTAASILTCHQPRVRAWRRSAAPRAWILRRPDGQSSGGLRLRHVLRPDNNSLIKDQAQNINRLGVGPRPCRGPARISDAEPTQRVTRSPLRLDHARSSPMIRH